jgi:phosphate transport system substrate-binding protein
MSLKRRHRIAPFFPMVSCLCWLAVLSLMPGSSSDAQSVIKYSCSNQLYAAFEAEKIALFTRNTGIQVDVFPASSGSAVFRLMNGTSDIAGTARQLYQRPSTFAYVQIPFCKDPIAVIVHADFPVKEISEDQLKNIFSGKIKNWAAITSHDMPIRVVVPDRSTAAYKNFHYQVLKHKKLEYDFSAQNAAMVIDAVQNLPMGAVSFISQGAALHSDSVKALKINGYAPREVHYPYYQTFYYITKGAPSGHVRKFIDFTFSAAGNHIIIKNGMLPLVQPCEHP